MKIPVVVAFNLMVLGGFAAPVMVTPNVVAAAADTEDVVYLTDGRVLHGRVLSTSGTEVEFEWLDKRGTTESKIKLTLDTTKIQRIERDVAKASTAPPAAPAAPAAAPKPASAAAPAAAASPAASSPAAKASAAGAGASSAPHLPRIYVIPMMRSEEELGFAQMGTDVHPDVYKLIRDDILKEKPDEIIIKMNCEDVEDRIYTRFDESDQGYDDSTSLDSYRELLDIFHKDLRDIHQTVWIKDSVGISSILALSWQDLYMMPNARLGGLEKSAVNFMAVKSDANKFGKFREAYMAWLKGFVEYGKYDLVLVDAMVRPEFQLSCSFVGRSVSWAENTEGSYVVDADKKKTVSFHARDAENVLLSDGTAESLDDLAFLLGYGEYELIQDSPKKIIEGYCTEWRRSFERAEFELQEYSKFKKWAAGPDAAKYLGQAKKSLTNILSAMNRFKAVEIRMGRDHGVTKAGLEEIIDRLNETLRSMKNSGKGPGSGSGSGSGGGAGPRGG